MIVDVSAVNLWRLPGGLEVSAACLAVCRGYLSTERCLISAVSLPLNFIHLSGNVVDPMSPTNRRESAVGVYLRRWRCLPRKLSAAVHFLH